MKNRKYRPVAFILSLFCLAFPLSACSGAEGEGGGGGTVPPAEEPSPPQEEELPLFGGKAQNTSKAGMYAEYLGTVPRTLPEISDGGLGKYPEYGVTLSASREERQAIIDENNALTASSSTYDAMDAEGNLYLNGQPTGGRLYKHTAAAGMYGGDVSDTEPALVKRLTYRSRPRGNLITGLYAPAGEVVKLEMSAEDFAATGGLTVYIGQALVNGGANNIWADRDLNRMPVILNVMSPGAAEGYVGSFLGGPLYVAPKKAGAEFSVTISGAVAYSHYVHGVTTEEEFARNAVSSAPYFDLEVWDDAVRHSGPKQQAKGFGYGELSAAAVLWDKIALVSNRVPAGSPGDGGIVFLYDPFVAAGSMVAFVGRYTVNCPPYVMRAALDAEGAAENPSDAFWGAIHEFNHHFQRFGFAPGDEVTNNAVSLVEYSLFTRVSGRRALGNADEGSYAVGWNRYTNPSWSLKQTLSAGGANSGLDGYANLLHAFGQDAFIRMTQAGGGKGGADAWFRAVCDVTGYDMTYYFTEVLHQQVSESVLREYAAKGLPVFVPAAVIFQTGRGYTSGGKTVFSRTAQPYGIETGKPFELNLKDNLVLPSGFAFEIKEVTDPAYGTLQKREEGVYLYTPDAANRDSGTIYVTVALKKQDGAFEAEDVTFAVELRQKQKTPEMLERTVYTYAPGNMYDSVEEAAENGFAGYESAFTEDNENRVQNGNAEIWEPDPGENAIMVVQGKFRADGGGRYRVALRGRRKAGLYLSFDGENYSLAALVNNQTNAAGFTGEEGSYTDCELSDGQWVYFRAVLLVTYPGSFIGVGLGKFDGDTVQVNYLNAYRASYEPEPPFESGYFYTRDYSYAGERSGKGSLLSSSYSPWDDSYSIENLFDADDSDFIHSDRTPISESNAFEVTADLGRAFLADTFTVYGESSRQYQPRDLKLYAGASPDDLLLVADVKDAPRDGANVTLKFAPRQVRCYRLVVTRTWDERVGYIAYRYAEFSLSLPGGTLYSPDEEMFALRGGWQMRGALADFGHVYAAEEDAVLEFTFTGTRFALFGEGGFEAFIDGAAAENLAAGEQLFLSEELPEGTHTVRLRCKAGFAFESAALWR